MAGGFWDILIALIILRGAFWVRSPDTKTVPKQAGHAHGVWPMNHLDQEPGSQLAFILVFALFALAMTAPLWGPLWWHQ